MIELLTPSQMAEVDEAAVAAGLPIKELMERAGYAVADEVAAQTPFGMAIAVLAGPGNNGGDAFVAARVLAERGYRVALVDLSEGKGGEAARAAARRYRGVRIAADDDRLVRVGVVIDGLFGGGLTRELDGAAAELIEQVNGADAKVYAVDLPSGIDGASGEVRGRAVRAHRTITFQRRKPGHLLLPGRAFTGHLTVADIGIRARLVESIGCQTFANEPELWRSARPQLDDGAHKYDRGHAVVVSGPMNATGAARLAATAALRSGAGLVTLASPADALLVNACHLTSVMLAKADGAQALTDLLGDRRLNVVALGPGLPPNEATRALVQAALASRASVVLDAGALTAFADEPQTLVDALQDKDAVLTPHAGEFARLFGDEGSAKLERVRGAAKACGAVVLEKGRDTVIAAPDGRAAINHNAPSYLATAGTGDVLTGIIAGLLAQGAPAFEAAAMGVWLHGDTAQRVGPALIADDLLAGLRQARAAFDAV